jgi:hypothetical protein
MFYETCISCRSVRYFDSLNRRPITFSGPAASLCEPSTAPVIEARSGVMGSFAASVFVDVAYGRGSDRTSAYAVTAEGVLCQFRYG